MAGSVEEPTVTDQPLRLKLSPLEAERIAGTLGYLRRRILIGAALLAVAVAVAVGSAAAMVLLELPPAWPALGLALALVVGLPAAAWLIAGLRHWRRYRRHEADFRAFLSGYGHDPDAAFRNRRK